MRHADIQKKYGLQGDRRGAFGNLYGYEAGVVTEQRIDTYYAVVNYLFKDPFTVEQGEAFKTAMKAVYASVAFQMDGKVVRMDLPGSLATKKKYERVDVLLRAAAAEFTRLGVRQHEGCGLCEGEGSDRLRLVRGLCMKTHDACHEKLMADVKEAYRKLDSSTENLAKGYFFAVSGALLGAIVNFVVNFYFGYQVVLLFALIPGAAMFMYKAAKAPLRKEIPFVIAGLSVVVSAVIIVLLYSLYAVSWGMTLSAFLRQGIPDIPDMMYYFVQDLGVATLFSLLGVMIIWRYLFKPRT